MAKTPTTTSSGQRINLVYAAYGLTVALVTAGYFFPNLRIWGLNFAAFLPWWATVIGLTVIVATLSTARLIDGWSKNGELTGKRWSVLVGVAALVFGVVFWLFRTQTHFLGDGYQILSFLSSNQPFLKPFEYGTAWLHLAVYNLIGSGDSAALASHRIVSIASGILYVLGAGYLAQTLLSSMWNRLLFLSGMITGGLTLLFYGYVENYSLLILSSLAFSIVGLKIAEHKMNRMWILLPLAAGLFFHILAITMIPAAIYLLISGTTVSRWYNRRSQSAKWLIVFASAVAVAIAGMSLYVNSLFLKLTVLPLVPHELNIPGYSLFSPAHLLDFANLLFVLVPGFLVLIGVLMKSPFKTHFESRSSHFLLWMSSTMLAAAFVFDPKLGMPRDWDLFAFASVPALILLYHIVLGGTNKHGRKAAVLSIGLSVVLLSLRVAVLAAPGPSLEYTKYIRDLDPIKTRNLWFVMIKYHRGRSEVATALEMQEEWSRRFPELEINRRAFEEYHRGRYLETIKLCRSIIERNPTYADAWLNAGVAYRALRRTDSALHYLEVANALSPYTPSVYINLAMVMIDRGSLSRAERLLDEAITTDSSYAALYYQYARIHRKQGNQPEYIEYLTHATNKSDADPTYLRELASAQLQAGDTHKAKAAFRRAVDMGLDSVSVDSMLREHPQLGG